jgi:hypothetical protein
MRAISLLNIVPIAIGLGGCTNSAVLQNPRQAHEIMVDTPAAQADDLPPFATIRSLSWAGSGCPAGTVAENLAPDLQAFTLLFDSYVAEIGPGLPLSQARRNCQILVDLQFPQGWSYSVFDVDYRGFANLDLGVSGIQQSNYYFQGEFLTSRLQTTLNGPRASDYQIRDSLPLNALVWSPCGAQRALIINSSVRVANNSGNPDARGAMSTDSIDGKVTHIYGLQWQRCPP